ncbi:MAG TPA: rhodanese-like domain-containing protein [Mariprofundaceae bacterium]|nr:rhodanese-like domain-containing protein [Mariprofundaceae bacterium]
MTDLMQQYGVYLFVGLILAWTAWTRWLGPRLAGVRSLSASDYLSHWRKETHLLLDVRSPGEYASQHAPDAVLVPLGDLRQKLDDIDKSKPVICICASGNRSAMAATTLARAGVKTVYNFSGGMAAWAAAGLPVHRGR